MVKGKYVLHGAFSAVVLLLLIAALFQCLKIDAYAATGYPIASAAEKDYNQNANETKTDGVVSDDTTVVADTVVPRAMDAGFSSAVAFAVSLGAIIVLGIALILISRQKVRGQER